MTDDEFNDYLWKKEKVANPLRFEAFMPQTSEQWEKERRQNEYEKNRPADDEYLGPF